MKTRMDHLVIGARDLDQGVAYVKATLGFDMPYGGMHVQMATHNHLVQLGNDMFLEIIAINPDLEPPTVPRWYGLDDPFVRQRFEEQPALLTWVINTPNMDALMRRTAFCFGTPTTISRGNLSWAFGLPDDGRLLAGGMLPYLIEWHTDQHPSVHMADAGCRFNGLHIYHPCPSWLESILKAIGAGDLVTVHPLQHQSTPYLVAYIVTPSGIKALRSDAGGMTGTPQ